MEVTTPYDLMVYAWWMGVIFHWLLELLMKALIPLAWAKKGLG